MSLEKSKIEAEELEKLRKRLLQSVAVFSTAPSEALYWEVTELLSEYGEAYLHHHQLDYDELDSLSTTTEAGIILPDNVVPFRR